jgi:hypothetical protein
MLEKSLSIPPSPNHPQGFFLCCPAGQVLAGAGVDYDASLFNLLGADYVTRLMHKTGGLGHIWFTSQPEVAAQPVVCCDCWIPECGTLIMVARSDRQGELTLQTVQHHVLRAWHVCFPPCITPLTLMLLTCS